MNTRQVRSQPQRGINQKNYGNNEVSRQTYTPQAVQKPVYQTNNASNANQQRQQQQQQQQPPAQMYQPNLISQHPQRTAVNTANLAPIPQVQETNPFNVNEKMDQSNATIESGGSEDMPPKPFLHRTKKKASAREIRQRQNRRLRKLLTPKNALMALYELIGNKNCDFKINADAKGFLAEVLVNNVRYEGRGTSKTQAKNDASEKALRDLIIQKMVERPKKITAADGSETMETEDVDMKEGEPNAVEVPMMHLASFALHKLFSEWQNEGFEIPDLKSTNPQEKVIAPKVSADKSELPANHETMHPSMLLSMMRPNTQYVDLGSEGTTPNVLHRFGVTIDGQSFVGQDRTKKLARKAVAIAACNAVFGTTFQHDAVRVVNLAKKEGEK
ncbi:uncharacterized protein LOC119068607 isoform X1 [Bradysia coprophila]|uniref:uncharacterized protein LOC119068607 isoform X1 n=2 Tax=Bradysia coprophila TaxID=38358 RepID=UPI00187DABB1|nr:uncharacterized protein LOC119068607 isoform X1 [Bradysia coprophila]